MVSATSIDVTINGHRQNEGPDDHRSRPRRSIPRTGRRGGDVHCGGPGDSGCYNVVVGRLTQSTVDQDDEDFEIDKTDGVLSFMKKAQLRGCYGNGGADATSNTYSVTVIATDADGIMSEKVSRSR